MSDFFSDISEQINTFTTHILNPAKIGLAGYKEAQALDTALATEESDSSAIEEIRAKWENDMDNNLYRFQYASILAHSRKDMNRKEAVLHLEYLINNSEDYCRDSLYLLATLRYLMHEYQLAAACSEELCRIDPDNDQVRNLHKAAKFKFEQEQEEARERQKDQQAVGVAVGVGVGLAAAAAIGLGVLLSKRNK